MGGYLSRKKGLIEQALNRFKTSQSLCNQFSEMENINKYEIGWCYFLNNKFKEARDLFEEFLEKHTSKTYKSWCYWQLGCCYYFLEDNDNAKNCMKEVESHKRSHYSWDEFASRKSKEFVKEVSSLEMNLFKIFNLISSNDINNAIKEIELLSEEIELCNDYNIYSYAIYLKGKIEIHLENEKSAISYFQEIIDNQK